MKRQKGIYTVEFAIVGVVFFLVLFGVIEIARALFVWNTIGEVTRRGARVAAVCQEDHPAIKEIALFNAPGGGAIEVLKGLTDANVTVEYLGDDGVSPATGDAIRYVRVSVSGYIHQLLIPFLPASVTDLTVPPFETTLPSESLGFNPDTGATECVGI